MKKIALLAPILSTTLASFSLPLISLSSCSRLTVELTANREDVQLHSLVFTESVDQLIEKGIKFGDSVDISGPNNFYIKDVPFYTGYYTEHGQWLLYSNEGTESLILGINGRSVYFNDYGFKKGDKFKIILNQTGKYLDVQNNLNLAPIKDQGEMDNYKYANFRDLNVNIEGKIKLNKVYRTFSPIIDSSAKYGNRREVVNWLCRIKNIKYVVDITDTTETITQSLENTGEETSWIKNKFQNNCIFCNFCLENDYQSNKFKSQIKSIFSTILNILESGSNLVLHCDCGVDKTGFISIILESITNNTLDTIKYDFMQSYVNLYGVATDSKSYELISKYYYDTKISEITAGCEDPTNLQACAEHYLESCGFTNGEIKKLEKYLVTQTF